MGALVSIESDYYNQYVGMTPEAYIRQTQIENPAKWNALNVSLQHSRKHTLSFGHRLRWWYRAQQRFNDHEVECVGLERSEPTAAAARNLFAQSCGRLSRCTSFEDKSFDFVMATNFEHLTWATYHSPQGDCSGGPTWYSNHDSV